MKRMLVIATVLGCLAGLAKAQVDYCWVSNIPPNFNLYSDADGTMVYSESSLITNNCNYPNGAYPLTHASVGGANALTLFVPKTDPNYLLFSNEIMLAKANGSTLNVMIRTSQYNATYGYPMMAVNIQ